MTPTTSWSSSTLSYTSIAATKRWGFCFDVSLAPAASGRHVCRLDHLFYSIRNPTFMCIRSETSSHICNWVLVLLVLACSSIACRNKIVTTAEIGVSIAKAQRPWMVVVGSWMSLQWNRSYPSPPKDWDTHTLIKSHRVCPKWFLCLWYIRCKPCTYLVLTQTLSPNGLKQGSTRPTSLMSTIRCV
jgi:hypothetical protein